MEIVRLSPVIIARFFLFILAAFFREESTLTFDFLTWCGAEGEHDNRPLLIRFREIPTAFPKSRYPWRLNIFWKMSEADGNGLPTDNEFDRVEVFEDRLIPAVEKDEHSILVSVLTCNEEREYVFYTTDVPVFMERLTNMEQECERYPITIQKYNDPSWRYFYSIVSTNG